MEGFRLVLDNEVSLSHEVLRTFLFALTLLVAAALACSISSSDEARASESGVDLRKPGFDFSSRREAGAWCAPKAPKAGMGARVGRPDLVGVLLMTAMRDVARG